MHSARHSDSFFSVICSSVVVVVALILVLTMDVVVVIVTPCKFRQLDKQNERQTQFMFVRAVTKEMKLH